MFGYLPPSNKVAFIVVFVGSIIVVRRLRPVTRSKKGEVWLPFAAVVLGPLTAASFLAIDALAFNPQNYRTSADIVPISVAFMIIGTLVGLLVGAVLWMTRSP